MVLTFTSGCITSPNHMFELKSYCVLMVIFFVVDQSVRLCRRIGVFNAFMTVLLYPVYGNRYHGKRYY